MPNFNETKTTQLAAYFLQKSEGELFLLKLMKLLYIADRESLRELGRPISFDQYVSMEHGPVLNHTLNLMNGMVRGHGIWSAMIAPRDNHKLRVVDESEVSFDALSEAEKHIADRIFEQFGHVNRFDLAEQTHEFAEWQDPQGSSIPIQLEKILSAVGYSDEEIPHILEDMHNQHLIDEFFECA